MKYIIGRDPQNSQVQIKNELGVKLKNIPIQAPQDVSREHILVTVVNHNSLHIHNIKAANISYVNGQEVLDKVIRSSDVVELGRSHFRVNLFGMLGMQKPMPVHPIQPQNKNTVFVDITQLKKVWDYYTNTKKEIKKRKSRMAAMAGIPMLISMVSGLIGFRFPPIFVLTGVSIVFMVYRTYAMYTDKSEDELEKNEEYLEKYYKCPKCNYPFRKKYNLLIQDECCPRCKAKFKA